MSNLFFVINYFLAISFFVVPSNFCIYYIIGILIYLLIVYRLGKKANVYQDVHPFLIGFASVWVAQLFSIETKENTMFTFVVLIYSYVLYLEKRNEENGEEKGNKIFKNIVYSLVIPLCAFFCSLYVFEQSLVPFLIYYSWLLYSMFESKFNLKSNVYKGFFLINELVIMAIIFLFVDFQMVEKIIFMVIFILTVTWRPKVKTTRG